MIFLYFFLPVFMGIYCLTRPKHRAKTLVLGSACFIAWAQPLGLINLAVSAFSAYVGGIVIYNFRESKAKSRAVLAACAVVNAAMFFAFAYSNYCPVDIVSGLIGRMEQHRLYTAFGAAVYTLHAISYCADVYKGAFQPENGFFNVCAYVGFMPSLTCGPILKYADIADTVTAPSIKSSLMSDGIMLFLRGLAEKVILANLLCGFWRDMHSAGADRLSAPAAWLGALIFGFWFYYEFQGFSHMARGFSAMLGFDIKPNFDLPFAKSTLKRFILSFNTSLVGWLGEYVYRPLCGIGKKTRLTRICAILFVSLLMGMWYGFGRNTILWSLFIAVFVCIEDCLEKPLSHLPLALRSILMQIIVIISWALLSGVTLSDSFEYLKIMFGGGNTVENGLTWYFAKTSLCVMILCIIFASPLFAFIQKKLGSIKTGVVTAAKSAIILALMILDTAFMLAQTGMSGFSF